MSLNARPSSCFAESFRCSSACAFSTVYRDIKAKKDEEFQQQDLARQRNTVTLLRVELDDNLKVANELRKNTIVFLRGFQTLSQVVRTPGIELLTAMFPAENIDLKIPDSQAAALAHKVFDDLERSQLRKNDLEMKKFTAAARAITTSIDLQMSTIQKLAAELRATGGFDMLTATLRHPDAQKLFQMKG